MRSRGIWQGTRAGAAFGTGLMGVSSSDVLGRRKRQYRAQRSGRFEAHRRKGKKKGKGKKNGCQPPPRAATCAGRCGSVQNTCQQTVDCGCCDNSRCAGATPICVNGTCSACSRHDQCGPNSLCLDNGSCQPCTVTCPGGTCAKDQLQAALNAGGTVYACPGRYRGGTINLPANVTLIGDGDGTNVTSDTILDGENVRRVLVPSAATMNVAHVRISGGRISGGFGAGVYHLGHSLTMTDCTIADNTNESIDGGGIYNQGDGVAENSLTMTRCKVEDNSARNGAGIFSITKLNLIACQITLNTASTNGGGIRVSAGTTTLDACTITGNHATAGGGGVYSSLVVEVKNGTTITGNTPDNCPGAAVPGCTG